MGISYVLIKSLLTHAFLESTHEVMVTKVKNTQHHTCTCAPHSIDLSCAKSCCSQEKPSFDEHVLVEKFVIVLLELKMMSSREKMKY
jgi:hypothetical protein